MTLTLPDDPATEFREEDLRMELACALYARGRITKVSAAQLAGASLSEFQRALGERQIESYTHEMLDDDIQAMRELFAQ